MNNFRTIDRQTGFLLPPSVDEWLPEKHLARFVVEVIDGMDLRAMSGVYRGSGSASYHPRMLLGILVYGYATGIFSSRKLERATYDSVAFRFIAANDHPDHDTIATFRRRFLKQIEGLFVQVLLLARAMGMLKLGILGLDGTKIHANASRHSTLSYEHAGKIEAQLKAEVAELMAKAEAADKADIPDGNEEFFQHRLVFDRSSLTRWRQRMGEEKLQALLQESLAVATRTEAIKPADLARVIVDTTVQPKAVMFPTDAKLVNRARERLVRLAQELGVELRQPYRRVGKFALIKHQRYAPFQAVQAR